jgi:uncharacterized repeat protein (TIGR03803 family)
MTDFGRWKNACAIFVLAVAISSPAQSFKTLVTFDGANGAYPSGISVAQGLDGSLYGMTSVGGSGCNWMGIYCGTIFKMTPGGALTTLYNFCTQANCADGAYPAASLVLGTDGNFYGTTSQGGSTCTLSDYGCGTVFKITSGGELTTLYRFCSLSGCADGGQPTGLLQAADGNLYGTTYLGGAYCNDQPGIPCGTVFKITPGGVLATLHSFCEFNGCTDGSGPVGLVQATNGRLYGTTTSYGANENSEGTVFEITPSGTLTTLYSFCSQTDCVDGSTPTAGLIQALDGNFYGTTSAGGVNAEQGHGGGTIFKVTAQGQLTTLYSFCARQVIGPQIRGGQVRCVDGSFPLDVLVQATDGSFYGTTSAGGAGGDDGFCGGPTGCGTIFRMNSRGTLATQVRFSGGVNGEYPGNGLAQATNGVFYGLTSAGGDSTCGILGSSCGTAYRLNTGLGPFVAFVQDSGRVGQMCGILGQGLEDTTSVFFNGTLASFTVVSDTFIKATIPDGATTGFVTVTTTPAGRLTSNVRFNVIR